MWIEITTFFLTVSVLLYSLFAGADFGGGILEFFRGRQLRTEQRELISHALSPVWEANHVWLILAIVILFVGFPKAYAVISTVFHIPLTLMLIGIILRGCAFTYRHYDAVKDRSHVYYSRIFVASSFLTPLMLGTIAGAIFLGRRVPNAQTFAEIFVAPWLNLFSFSVGTFTCILFSFLAAIYLLGEAPNENLRALLVTRAKTLNGLAVLSGLSVFLAAEWDGLPLLHFFLGDPWALGCVVMATLLLAPLWLSLKFRSVIWSRFLVAAQVTFILMGWFRLQFPALVVTRIVSSGLMGMETLNIYNSAAPEATLRPLVGALIVGSVLIFPALIYLLKIFKSVR